MMDYIYKYMSCTPDVSFDEMDRFRQYIDFEEYDTDSLFNDIEDYNYINHLNQIFYHHLIIYHQYFVILHINLLNINKVCTYFYIYALFFM